MISIYLLSVYAYEHLPIKMCDDLKDLAQQFCNQCMIIPIMKDYKLISDIAIH